MTPDESNTTSRIEKKLPNVININQSGPLRVIFLFLKKKAWKLTA